MLLRDYELVMVISPEVNEEEAANTLDRVARFITERGGSITNQEHWGLRRLAYPIDRFHEGNYFLTRLTLGPQIAKELEGSLRVSEEVLRHLLVRVV